VPGFAYLGVCESLCESVSELLRGLRRTHLLTWSHPGYRGPGPLELEHGTQSLQVTLLVAPLERTGIQPPTCRRNVVWREMFPLRSPDPPESVPEAPVRLFELALAERFVEPPGRQMSDTRLAQPPVLPRMGKEQGTANGSLDLSKL
jgi:hypothetical protein